MFEAAIQAIEQVEVLPDGLLDVGVDCGIVAHEHLHPEEAVAEALIQAVELGVESDDGAGHPDPDPVPILSRSECVGKWIESWVVLSNAFRWSQDAARCVPRKESTSLALTDSVMDATSMPETALFF